MQNPTPAQLSTGFGVAWFDTGVVGQEGSNNGAARRKLSARQQQRALPPDTEDGDTETADAPIVAEAIFTEFDAPLKAFVRQFVPGSSKSHADDVVQETYLRTLTHISNGNTVRSPKSFLFRTAQNLVTSKFFRGSFTKTDTKSDLDAFITDANQVSAERRAMIMQTIDALAVGIAELPRKHRAAFIEMRVLGEDAKTVAKKLGVTPDKVYAYAYYAHRKMDEYCKRHKIELDDLGQLPK